MPTYNIDMLRAILQQKNMTLYQLEKSSHLPHATLSDLFNEKTNAEKCSSNFLHSLAKFLDMSMDELYEKLTYQDLTCFDFDKQFDLFKSSICQELKNIGYKKFLFKYLNTQNVWTYYQMKMMKECLYLLSLIDYLCESHDLPLVKEYDEIRQYKLSQTIVPESIYLLLKTKQIKVTDIFKKAIMTFLRHNIIESEIENVY